MLMVFSPTDISILFAKATPIAFPPRAATRPPPCVVQPTDPPNDAPQYAIHQPRRNVNFPP